MLPLGVGTGEPAAQCKGIGGAEDLHDSEGAAYHEREEPAPQRHMLGLRHLRLL